MGMWYVFQPFLINIANVIDTATQSQGLNSTSSDQIFTLGRVSVNVTFPIFIIGLWIWGWMESQRKDYRGYPYE